MADLFNVKDVFNKVKNAVMQMSEMEAKVREATNTDAWGASSTLMQEIANATHNFQDFNEIMMAIWKRYQEKNWRSIYKALTLLEYLIKNGSERVAEYASQHTFEMKNLQNFQHVDEKGKDQGINIRQRAKEIVSLLGDPSRVKDEREKARINKNKYKGVGSETMSGFDNFSSGNNGGSNYNSNVSSPGADNSASGKQDKPDNSFSSVNTIRSTTGKSENSFSAKSTATSTFANDLLDFSDFNNNNPSNNNPNNVSGFSNANPFAFNNSNGGFNAFSSSSAATVNNNNNNGFGVFANNNNQQQDFADFADFSSAPKTFQTVTPNAMNMNNYNYNNTNSNNGSFFPAAQAQAPFPSTFPSNNNNNAFNSSAIPTATTSSGFSFPNVAPMPTPTSNISTLNSNSPKNNLNDLWNSNLVGLDSLGKFPGNRESPKPPLSSIAVPGLAFGQNNTGNGGNMGFGNFSTFPNGNNNKNNNNDNGGWNASFPNGSGGNNVTNKNQNQLF